MNYKAFSKIAVVQISVLIICFSFEISYARYSLMVKSVGSCGVNISSGSYRLLDTGGQSTVGKGSATVGYNLKIGYIYALKKSYSSIRNGLVYGGASKLSKVIRPNPTFKLGEVYSFPNPAKGGKNPIIHVEVGIADKVDVGIYNIAGELVDVLAIDGSQSAIVRNKYCYEYEWDTKDKASGVYIYLIQAQKQGYDTIKVIKKLAIVK